MKYFLGLQDTQITNTASGFEVSQKISKLYLRKKKKKTSIRGYTSVSISHYL